MEETRGCLLQHAATRCSHETFEAHALSSKETVCNMKKKTIFGKTPKPPRSMSREAVERATHADADAQPLTPADVARMKRTPQVKVVRRALDLTQEEFADRYHIPLGTLRDWEQGRAEPDQPTKAYLTLIARDPEHVDRTLNSRR